MRGAVVFSLVLLAAAGCDAAPESGKVPLGAAGPAPGSAAATPAMAGDSFSGTVLEQIPAAPYVYLRLKAASGEVWAAVNLAPVTVGQSVTVYGAILMENFASKTLNRTFPQIYFGSLEPVAQGGAAGAPGSESAGGAAGPGAAAGGAMSTGTPPAVDAKVGRVDKAAGADARTIGEVWAQKGGLDGKVVTVRGVVVKYNPQVMGRNWIHLQDGSGAAAQGTHDLAVTTADAAAMGATITIRGLVRLNKDFGAGYSYPLLVEDAKILK